LAKDLYNINRYNFFRKENINKIDNMEKNLDEKNPQEVVNEGVEEQIPTAESEATQESTPEETTSDADNLALQEEKYAKLQDDYLRLRAEFDNYRKRTLKEKSELLKSAGESVLLNILPLVDDFERAQKALENVSDVESMKEGINLIYEKFISFLAQNGVKAIETEGKEFDLDFHEAITTIPAPSEDLKGKVIDCTQKGYVMNDKVIRFAKVVVGQ
jgi:molecular chaperone GrpE